MGSAACPFHLSDTESPAPQADLRHFLAALDPNANPEG